MRTFTQEPVSQSGELQPILPAAMFRKVRRIPGQARLPLSNDERVAQDYSDRPARLLQLAEATGNRSLKNIALAMLRESRERRKVYT